MPWSDCLLHTWMAPGMAGVEHSHVNVGMLYGSIIVKLAHSFYFFCFVQCFQIISRDLLGLYCLADGCVLCTFGGQACACLCCEQVWRACAGSLELRGARVSLETCFRLASLLFPTSFFPQYSDGRETSWCPLSFAL